MLATSCCYVVLQLHNDFFVGLQAWLGLITAESQLAKCLSQCLMRRALFLQRLSEARYVHTLTLYLVLHLETMTFIDVGERVRHQG